MGLLDDVLGQGAAAAGGKNAAKVAAVLGAIELVRQCGGLHGLADKLRSGGLGGAVGSWIGTGANQPVSPGALESALGSGVLHDIAAKFGIDPSEVASHMSQALPQVVDQATPTGAITAGGEIPDDLAHQLSGLLRG
jgi:uncharacterized protein YidB (DUF937 family)